MRSACALWAANERGAAAAAPGRRRARGGARRAAARRRSRELYGKIEFKPEELGAVIKQGKPPADPRDARPPLPGGAHRSRRLGARARRSPACSPTRRSAAISSPWRARGGADPRRADAERRVGVVRARGGARALCRRPRRGGASLARACRRRGDAGTARADAARRRPPRARRRRRGAAGRRSPRSASSDAAQGALLLSVLPELGITVTPGDWAPLIGAPHGAAMPDFAVWIAPAGRGQRQAPRRDRADDACSSRAPAII